VELRPEGGEGGHPFYTSSPSLLPCRVSPPPRHRHRGRSYQRWLVPPVEILFLPVLPYCCGIGKRREAKENGGWECASVNWTGHTQDYKYGRGIDMEGRGGGKIKVIKSGGKGTCDDGGASFS
jgi:hypothetical protein